MNSIPGIIQQQLQLLNSTGFYSRYPHRTRTTKNVTPLESSHCRRRPARAASARTAQLANAVSTSSERRRHPDAERARRVESIMSAV